ETGIAAQAIEADARSILRIVMYSSLMIALVGGALHSCRPSWVRVKIVLALSFLLSLRAGCGRSIGLYRGKAAIRLRDLR
ncbi:hypothetical protein AB9F41_37415, partial [Rhizobium leguminosarum]|uniref:hypothetical protein n=1 Tax=Rhizobium leguminosarum TaxID=384 RepID=UPI003F94F8E7